jgi:hypothetical protein
MASTFAVTRNHLIFGLCLPLAVLLGYVLAEPLESTSMTVMLMVVAVFAVPVLMRWHHPLLVLSWCMVAQAPVPGRPHLWAAMAFLALLFSILNRAVNAENRFHNERSLTRPMLVLAVVVLATAMVTGGIGVRAMGSGAVVGGRGYIYILAAIAGFFAFCSRPIPQERAKLYVGLFFLSGLTGLIGPIAGRIGPSAAFLGIIFPLPAEPDTFEQAGPIDPSVFRVEGMVAVSVALVCWLLARYGVAGVLKFSQPWRAVAFIAAVAVGMFGGFRSSFLFVAVICAILFLLERLWRTSLVISLAVAGVLGGALLVGFADKLPFPVQRAMSILPLDLDYEVRQSAEHSSQWRVEMWKAVLPQVPDYLFKGKGYNLSADDLFMAQMSKARGVGNSWDAYAFTGDYHNGPLSVVIPFGIYGVIAFAWLLIAGARFLYTVYRDGAAELRRVNALLLAMFLARILMFLFIFGSLYVELCQFTGILGLSVALNANRGSQTSNEGAADEAAHADA